MSDSTLDVWTPWTRWSGLLAERLGKERGRDLASVLAELLEEMLPQARFVCCRANGETASRGSASLPLPVRAPSAVERLETLSGIVLMAGFSEPGLQQGILAIGLPCGLSEDSLRSLGLGLGLAATILTQQLQLENLRSQQQEAEDLTTAGEAAVGMVHAINNHLNSMILQAMAVQVRLSEPLKSELGNVRLEGLQAANRLRQLQSIRERPLDPGQPTNLNQAITATLRADLDLTLRTDLRLAPALPELRLPYFTVLRLVRLLLHTALQSHSSNRPLPIRTEANNGTVSLILEVDGPTVDRDPARLTDLQGLADGLAELERTAVHYLVRRLEGALEVTHRAGGVTVRLTWSENPSGMQLEQSDP